MNRRTHAHARRAHRARVEEAHHVCAAVHESACLKDTQRYDKGGRHPCKVCLCDIDAQAYKRLRKQVQGPDTSPKHV